MIEGTGDLYGSGVALSGDGLTLAASSPNSGYLSIFKFNGVEYEFRKHEVFYKI